MLFNFYDYIRNKSNAEPSPECIIFIFQSFTCLVINTFSLAAGHDPNSANVDADLLHQEFMKDAKNLQKVLTNLLIEEKNILASIAKVNLHCLPFDYF